MNVETLKAWTEVKRIWNLACNHDRINPEAKFAVLSDRNPHKGNYEKAMSRLQELRRKANK